MKIDLSTLKIMDETELENAINTGDTQKILDNYEEVTSWKYFIEEELRERLAYYKELVEFDKAKNLTDLWARDQMAVDLILEFLGEHRK